MLVSGCEDRTAQFWELGLPVVSCPALYSVVVWRTPVADIGCCCCNQVDHQRDHKFSCGNHSHLVMVGGTRPAALVLLEHIASLEV